jgi:hypothetical protein
VGGGIAGLIARHRRRAQGAGCSPDTNTLWVLIAELLSTTPGATSEKVEGLVTNLWQHSVLLTDLRPPLTTDSPARYVAERLSDIPAADDAQMQLEALLEAMKTWDVLPPKEGTAAYRKLMNRLNRLAPPRLRRLYKPTWLSRSTGIMLPGLLVKR